MEAINSLANTASKAIWGDPNQEEPVSGVKGDTSKGEPFDAGNKGGTYVLSLRIPQDNPSLLARSLPSFRQACS